MLIHPAATVGQNFSGAMLILVQGMAGIFVFMGVFYALIIALERIFRSKTEK